MAGVFLIALTSLTIIGCGKNVVGPTAPQAISSQVLDAVQQSTAVSGANTDANSLQAACLGNKGKRYRWTHRRFNAFLSKFNPWSVKKFINKVLKLHVDDPEVRKTVKHILSSRLFYIITFRCGLGPYLFKACLRVLMQSWSPGLGTYPDGFDNPEVTLFPYAWNPYSGFYGDLDDLESRGWTNGEGYYLESRNTHIPETFTSIVTKSYFNNTASGHDIYKNEKANEIYWDFKYSPKLGMLSWISMGLFLNSTVTQQCIVIKNSSNGAPIIREPNGNQIFFGNVRASTQNLAAVCNMSSTKDGLDMKFELDESGKGGGKLFIPNGQGGIDEYYFKVKKANGRSYWTKNDGRKNFF